MKKLLSFAAVTAFMLNGFSAENVHATVLTSDHMFTEAEIKNDYDYHYREGTIDYYFRFVRSDDLTVYACDKYMIGEYPLWIRITSDERFDSDEMSQILGKEIEQQFGEFIRVNIDDNQHVYEYSGDIDYSLIYEKPEVEKLEFIKTTYVSNLRKSEYTIKEDSWIDKNGIEREGSNIVYAKIYTQPDTVITEETFSDIDTEIIYVKAAGSLIPDTDGVSKWKSWGVAFRFNGDYSIFTKFDETVREMDEKSYLIPKGFQDLLMATGKNEYFDYDYFCSDVNDNQTENIKEIIQSAASAHDSKRLGDINSDGSVDLTDLTELSLALVDNQELTENQVKAADINNNGNADLTDLATLKQYISRQIDSLG